ncbi:DinB family protein [Paracidobacterium acidisoli]|uniref:DUF664 domain-containing protein n=1 Tax=Paracidobacterium acidisoli TaxID=2303751 RepID=A0A372IKB6_9BACT|nr:DinB family protein [Paracidobacterium acidisoli]MBT9332723.1 DinB family protein [Paracidobacterium acidisoli]
MSIAETLLPEFDEEYACTRKFLALVPDDKLTWKPHEKSMELGRLAWHVSDFPEWCSSTITKDKLDLSDTDAADSAGGWQGKQRADMLSRFDANLPQARAALASASDDAMNAHWKMIWNGQAIIDDPRTAVYRRWVISHMVHHRAQLGVYLRLLGVPIPGAYGPSADQS